MAVFAVHVYRADKGRGNDMVATMLRAKTIFEANGAVVSLWQAQLGGVAGSVAFVDAYDGMGTYGRCMDAVAKSEDFQALVQEIITKPSGTNVENYRLEDLDATLGLPTVLTTVLHQVVHRTIPGKAVAHLTATATAIGHLTRLGAQARAVRMVGRGAGGIATLAAFEDFTHYGEFGEKLAVDEQWNSFYAGLASDPPAEEIESGMATLIQL